VSEGFRIRPADADPTAVKLAHLGYSAGLNPPDPADPLAISPRSADRLRA
jgi:hypothetical protein